MAFWFRGLSLALLAGGFLAVVAARADSPAQQTIATAGSMPHISGFTVYAGEMRADLRGTGLRQVASVTVNSVAFDPGVVTRAAGPNGAEEMTATAQSTLKLRPATAVGVDVMFKDGRMVHLDGKVQPPRPEAELLSKTLEGAADLGFHLANPDDLPQNATLVFSVRTTKGSGNTSGVEVATEDDAHITRLSDTGGFTGSARFSPAKAFGPSVTGPLKFRVLEGEEESDWVPLANVVRVPHLASLSCPADPSQDCKLSGSNLFLLESVAADSSYQQAITVPANFRGEQLQVPYPAEAGMVVKLRDDITVANPVTLRTNAAGVSPAAKP